jgi:hypothetical protein
LPLLWRKFHFSSKKLKTGYLQLKIIKLLLVFLLPVAVLAQPRLLQINHLAISRMEPLLYTVGANFHTASKPFVANLAMQVQGTDSLQLALVDSGGPIKNRFANLHWLKWQKGKMMATLDPYLDVLPGLELNNGFRHETTYGANIGFSLSDKLHVNAILSQGVAEFPSFIDSFARADEVVPGRGYAFFDGSNNARFRNNFGYASYSPSQHFNLQVGFGRNFIGDGYRSLLLSDNAYNYPYAKVTTNIWKLQYINLFTNFSDIRGSEGVPGNFYNKYGAFHFLSWNITKRINIGLFEGVIFENRDTTGRRFTYDINYLNPIIFYRPVEFAMGSADNVLMGLNYKITLFKNQTLYGQVMIDEFLLDEIRADAAQAVRPDPNRRHGWWANKYGFQVGIKWFNLFWLKNLQLQAELNTVRPYSYTHSSVFQNYGHYNQPLAHPLGANFREYIGVLRYHFNRFSAEARMVYSQLGDDTENVYFGRDIFQSYRQRPYEYGHFTGQGLNTRILYNELKLCWLINPKNHLQIQAGMINRQMAQQGNPLHSSTFFYAGIRTAIFNWYYDR